MFDGVFYVNFSLTNFHIHLHPLCEEDHVYYKKVMAIIKQAAGKMKNDTALCQTKYRSKRKRIDNAVRAAREDFNKDRKRKLINNQ